MCCIFLIFHIFIFLLYFNFYAYIYANRISYVLRKGAGEINMAIDKPVFVATSNFNSSDTQLTGLLQLHGGTNFNIYSNDCN
ncbi:hypothetical protein CW304_29685 [Bacillus sp. UFRGS-B20]|nr:hypothetical protein CW304_29685 [Bacillus sp. UFRGS-B20]